MSLILVGSRGANVSSSYFQMTSGSEVAVCHYTEPLCLHLDDVVTGLTFKEAHGLALELLRRIHGLSDEKMEQIHELVASNGQSESSQIELQLHESVMKELMYRATAAKRTVSEYVKDILMLDSWLRREVKHGSRLLLKCPVGIDREVKFVD